MKINLCSTLGLTAKVVGSIFQQLQLAPQESGPCCWLNIGSGPLSAFFATPVDLPRT